ncbi:MAG: polysaccharide deacetylase family protein [Methylocystis sp.]|nr:polysaccharide deacetylase family protein [Methylocystis sp.]
MCIRDRYNWRWRAIEVGMRLLRASGAHRLAEPYTRGLGALLMFHRVRPSQGDEFDPNAGLAVTPDFLDALLTHVATRGYDIVSLDAALASLRAGGADRPFVALTFDDGYRDFADHALPILERHAAPFTLYVTSGFADGAARLWWLELEEAVRRLNHVCVCVAGRRVARACATAREKTQTFWEIYWLLRQRDESELRRGIDVICEQAGLDPLALTRENCLNWEALTPLARHPLATIGAHSVTHARLARVSEDEARREIADCRAAIAGRLGVDARHFCYPVGDRASAGAREFALAEQLGFASGVTTRPGVLYAGQSAHLFALPRLSVNGRHQNLDAFDVLLSGAPFALINRGRRVAA